MPVPEPKVMRKTPLFHLSEARARIKELEAFIGKVASLQPGDAGASLKCEAQDLLQKSNQK